ncbi:hypothetical protein ACWPM1_02730 [Tsuneonella sp. HG249]
MRGYMFRNRWFALLFVALVLAGVTRLVGTGNGDGALDIAKQQIAEQKVQAERLTTESKLAAPEAKVLFTPDDELIDPAVGEDPTPVDQLLSDGTEDTEDDEVPHDTVILVSPNSAEPPTQMQAVE